MQKWIRWKGLVAFVCVVGLIGLVWILSIDGIVERNLEKYGTKAIGAKVELAKATVSLFPAGLELNDLQVTNPDEPMENAVQVSRISLTIDTLSLLRRKMIVNEMTLEGMRLNTPRRSSGAVVSEKGTAKKQDPVDTGGKKDFCKKPGLPQFDQLDVKEIVRNERLETLALVASFQTDLDAEKKKWEARLADLPNRETFDNYRKRIDKLRSGSKGFSLSMLSSIGDASNIAKDIKQDMDRLQQTKQDFDQALVDINQRIEKAKRAPYEDLNRLKNKYGLSPEGLNNLSQLVLGAKLCGWMQKAAKWYGKMKP
ncbi:MAG: TIGR03545 family protein, partial [Desulfobacterales bacterium]